MSHVASKVVDIYLEEICDVGVARSHPSPVELGVVPVVEDEWCCVDEEEIGNSFIRRKENFKRYKHR
jgi:hypothetical protein